MRDIRYSEALHKNWTDTTSKIGIDGISKTNSDLIIEYISDLEKGENLGKTRKGKRSYNRLIATRTALIKLAKMLEDRGINSFKQLEKEPLRNLFEDFRKGEIKTKDDKNYSPSSIATYAIIIKAFWNWYRRKYEIRKDIVEDLDTSGNETRFVYITKDQVDKILPYLSYQEQLITRFIFDSLARPPKEVLSLKGKDVYERDGQVWVDIPDGDEEGKIAKTFGRCFNLLYCGDDILKRKKEIEEDEYLFEIDYKEYCRKLKQIAKKELGTKISHPKAKKRFDELEPYDLRHGGTIHLRVLAHKNNAISLDAVRQRGGWKDFDMLNWYTQFIGITGEIRKESLLLQEDKTQLEKEINVIKKENAEIKKAIDLILTKGIEGMKKKK